MHSRSCGGGAAVAVETLLSPSSSCSSHPYAAAAAAARPRSSCWRASFCSNWRLPAAAAAPAAGGGRRAAPAAAACVPAVGGVGGRWRVVVPGRRGAAGPGRRCLRLPVARCCPRLLQDARAARCMGIHGPQKRLPLVVRQTDVEQEAAVVGRLVDDAEIRNPVAKQTERSESEGLRRNQKRQQLASSNIQRLMPRSNWAAAPPPAPPAQANIINDQRQYACCLFSGLCWRAVLLRCRAARTGTPQRCSERRWASSSRRGPPPGSRS